MFKNFLTKLLPEMTVLKLTDIASNLQEKKTKKPIGRLSTNLFYFKIRKYKSQVVETERHMVRVDNIAILF